MGAAPTPGQELARTQFAKADARDRWLAARDHDHRPGRRARRAAALTAYEQASAAFAEAARAFWASEEGQAYTAARVAYLSRQGLL